MNEMHETSSRPSRRNLQPTEVHRRLPSASVVIPARNESGNIDSLLERLPELGSMTELIFVEGHSRDDTYTVISEAISADPLRNCRLYRQTGVGKGDAVRLGFSKARGDILMIIDADMTIEPERLADFYEALVEGKGDFINGVRFSLPMEKNAMRRCNLIGNKFFSRAMSKVTGQNVSDTLCGTKALWRRDYERIVENRSFVSDFDPFGDFDLLLGAAGLGLKIHDLPVRYAARSFGETNIRRWRHGFMLLQMVLAAAMSYRFSSARDRGGRPREEFEDIAPIPGDVLGR